MHTAKPNPCIKKILLRYRFRNWYTLRSYDPYRYLQNLPPVKYYTSRYNLWNNQWIRITYRIRSYEAAFVTCLRTPTLVITLRRVVMLIRVVFRKLFTLYDIAKYLYRICLLANNLPINYIILLKYTILIRYIFFLTTYFIKYIIVFKELKSLYDIINLSLYRTVMLNRLLSYYLCVVISCNILPIIFRYLLPLCLPYSLVKII